MVSLYFTEIIHAPKEVVWNTMLEKPTYELWSSAFSEWSTYQWSREKWSEIRFVDPEGMGMIAEIADNRLYEYISIHHLGEIQFDDTWKITEYEYDGAWHENYTFTHQSDGTTELNVELTNIPDDYTDMFNEMWPKALEILKGLCEK